MYFIKESPFLISQQVSMKTAMENLFFVLFFMLEMFLFSSSVLADNHISAVGDPGMKRDGLRVAFEAWNFCNEVGSEAPQMGSPRAADCFDLSNSSLVHKVTEAENRLGVGKPFPGLSSVASNNPDLHAAEKEQYLGSLCEVEDTPNP
eukprot:TRINITY_DN6540_c0_g1_i5.p1 TRINITY_DN6540_c0_g1~~TRINITY_DN6540_c0_g1_i5.p1  ORF type:complete len:148 (+),score=39.94 TRINITY_DN6540_c0_g1_i5:2396-2839(+)